MKMQYTKKAHFSIKKTYEIWKKYARHKSGLIILINETVFLFDFSAFYVKLKTLIEMLWNKNAVLGFVVFNFQEWNNVRMLDVCMSNTWIVWK